MVEDAKPSETVIRRQRQSQERRSHTRKIKLGPYLLLQTLGEGEFGKVKLGIHTETGQEVNKDVTKHFTFLLLTLR